MGRYSGGMLTDQQAAVLSYIEDFIGNFQYPPTRAEIARAFGWKSANAAEEHLRAIERKGRIELVPGVARGLRVVA